VLEVYKSAIDMPKSGMQPALVLVAALLLAGQAAAVRPLARQAAAAAYERRFPRDEGDEELNLRPLIGVVSQVSLKLVVQLPQQRPHTVKVPPPLECQRMLLLHPLQTSARRTRPQGPLLHRCFLRQVCGKRWSAGSAHFLRHEQGGGGASLQGGRVLGARSGQLPGTQGCPS
jgi:Ser/Thr protein kinase RdoA (MazF antagonist)